MNYQYLIHHELDESKTETVLDYQEQLHQSSKKLVGLRSRDFRRESLKRSSTLNKGLHNLYVFDESTIVGHGELTYTHSKQYPKCYATVHVLNNYRQQGIGTKVLDRLITLAKTTGKTVILGSVWHIEDPGYIRRCLTNRGWTPDHSGKVSWLTPDTVNWDYINQREPQLEEKFSNLDFRIIDELTFSKRVVEDDDFATMYAALSQQIYTTLRQRVGNPDPVNITASFIQEKMQHILDNPRHNGLNCYTFRGDDEVVGYSQTTYYLDPPIRDVGVAMTGVRNDMQNQGLATLMKIKVIREFVENQPSFEYMRTENAGKNLPMLKINKNVGFVTYSDYSIYQRKLRT